MNLTPLRGNTFKLFINKQLDTLVIRKHTVTGIRVALSLLLPKGEDVDIAGRPHGKHPSCCKPALLDTSLSLLLLNVFLDVYTQRNREEVAGLACLRAGANIADIVGPAGPKLWRLAIIMPGQE